MRIYTSDEKEAYGYSWDGMVAFDKEMARAIFHHGHQNIYKLYEAGTEGIVESEIDLFAHDGYFGVEVEI